MYQELNLIAEVDGISHLGVEAQKRDVAWNQRPIKLVILCFDFPHRRKLNEIDKVLAKLVGWIKEHAEWVHHLDPCRRGKIISRTAFAQRQMSSVTGDLIIYHGPLPGREIT